MGISVTGDVYEADVIVIGSGAAGIRAAIAASDGGARVMMLTKGRLCQTGSTFYPLTPGWGVSAATGLADPSDSIEAHYEDIIAAAQGMCDPGLARILATEAPVRLKELEEMGILIRPVEGCHCFNRKPRSVMAYDMSNIKKVLGDEVRRRGVTVIEGCRATSIILEEGECAGVRGVMGVMGGDPGGGQPVKRPAMQSVAQPITVYAPAVILATGGGGGLFKYNLTTRDVAGDGYALALRAGATLTNMEFIQMSFGMVAPVWSALFTEQFFEYQPRLVNGEGEEFIERYLPRETYLEYCYLRKTHAPYTVTDPSSAIDRAIFSEILAGRGTERGGIIVDFSHVPRSELESGPLGGWLRWMKRLGADLYEDRVEIAPFVQAFNGGVVIDEQCQTTVPGLFACGEVAAGPHGADRLGGNMMASTMVFGARAGSFAAQRAKVAKIAKAKRRVGASRTTQTDSAGPAAPAGTPGRSGSGDAALPAGAVASGLVEELRQMMSLSANVIRDEEGLRRGLERIEALKREYGLAPEGPVEDAGAGTSAGDPALLDLLNALLVDKVILEAALLRRESRGGHFRSDYPTRNDTEFGTRLEVRI
ncbi:MAG: FAD-binding protein [Firmicutes bacterium]|nr:FAD-binding protein [Bacillota bacterium]